MIGIFRDHLAPLDFAVNTDMAKEGSEFSESFLHEKSLSF